MRHLIIKLGPDPTSRGRNQHAESPGILQLTSLTCRPCIAAVQGNDSGAAIGKVGDDEDPHEILGALTGAMPSGSYLVLSTACHDADLEASARARDMYKSASSPLVTRSRDEIAAFFARLDLVEPGLVLTSRWRSPAHQRTRRSAGRRRPQALVVAAAGDPSSAAASRPATANGSSSAARASLSFR